MNVPYSTLVSSRTRSVHRGERRGDVLFSERGEKGSRSILSTLRATKYEEDQDHKTSDEANGYEGRYETRNGAILLGRVLSRANVWIIALTREKKSSCQSGHFL